MPPTVRIFRDESPIEKVELVKVSRSEFRRMDLHLASEKPCSLEKGHNVGGADIGLAVSGLYALVLPTVSLWEGDQTGSRNVSPGTLNSHLADS